MIRKIATNFAKTSIFNQQCFKFSGGQHHQIDYQAIVTKNPKSGYYINPHQAARRVARIIASMQGVQNIQKLTLRTQWFELGLNELDYVQLTVLVEDEFKIQFPDDVAQKFKDVNDMVEYVSRSFWAA